MVDNLDVGIFGPEETEEDAPPTPVSFEEIEENQLEIPSELYFIRDIPIQVSAELGRSKIQVRELLQLHVNQILEMDKMVGDPLEIYINGQIVARGEVVVINDKFGIRLTDIINHLEQGLQI